MQHEEQIFPKKEEWILRNVLDMDPAGLYHRIVVTPDGSHVIYPDDYGYVNIRNMYTNELLRRFKGVGGSVRSICISASGSLVGVCSDDARCRLRVYRFDTGRRVGTNRLRHEGGPVRALAFTHDDTRVVSVGDDGDALVWSLLDNTKPPVRLEPSRQPPLPLRRGDVYPPFPLIFDTVSVSKDDRFVAIGRRDGTAFVCDLNSGRKVLRINRGLDQRRFGSGRWLAFSHNDRFMYASDRGGVAVWDMKSSPPAVLFDVESASGFDYGTMTSADITPDGEHVMISFHGRKPHDRSSSGAWRTRVYAWSVDVAGPEVSSTCICKGRVSGDCNFITACDYETGRYDRKFLVYKRFKEGDEYLPVPALPPPATNTAFAEGVGSGMGAGAGVGAGADVGAGSSISSSDSRCVIV